MFVIAIQAKFDFKKYNLRYLHRNKHTIFATYKL